MQKNWLWFAKSLLSALVLLFLPQSLSHSVPAHRDIYLVLLISLKQAVPKSSFTVGSRREAGEDAEAVVSAGINILNSEHCELC